MSMTFWVYTKVNGEVSTDQEDRYYIYQFLDQLDALCRVQELTEISELCDYSGALSIFSEDEDIDELDEFSEHHESASEDSEDVTWMAAHEARDLLIYLLNVLADDPAALDIEEDEYEGLCGEITECLDIIHAALNRDADSAFNLSLIM